MEGYFTVAVFTYFIEPYQAESLLLCRDRDLSHTALENGRKGELLKAALKAKNKCTPQGGSLNITSDHAPSPEVVRSGLSAIVSS